MKPISIIAPALIAGAVLITGGKDMATTKKTTKKSTAKKATAKKTTAKKAVKKATATPKKKVAKKATKKQLDALKKGREALKKKTESAKKAVRKELAKTKKAVKKSTSKIMSSARKKATKATAKQMTSLSKRLKKKGLAGTKRFRLSKSDGIHARSFDKNGNLITSIDDSGFSDVKSVKDALIRKNSFKKLCEFTILIIDKDEYARYDNNCKRI